MPVALASTVRHRTAGLRATTSTACGCTPRPTCVGHAGRGPRRRSKGLSMPRTVCGALLPALRAPGSPASGSTRVGARVQPSRRSRFSSHAVSRKAGVRGRIEVPSSVPKPRHAWRMTPPSGQGPRPPHAASVEALLGGARAFCTVSAPPGSDEPSGRRGSPRRVQGAEAPGTERRAAPVTASTTESARGQMCRELHDPKLQ